MERWKRGPTRGRQGKRFSKLTPQPWNHSRALIAGRSLNLAPILNGKAQALFQSREFLGGSFRLDEQSSSLSALRCLNGLPGLAFAAPSRGEVEIRLDNAGTARLLCGVWLEAILFNRLRALTHGGPARVAANLALQDRIFKAGREDWGEADIALMINDQLHVIEAKAAVFRSNRDRTSEGRDARSKALQQANLFRGRLLGQFGKFWIVNPLASSSDLTPGFRQRINAVGRMVLGESAIDQVVTEVAELLPR